MWILYEPCTPRYPKFPPPPDRRDSVIHGFHLWFLHQLIIKCLSNVCQVCRGTYQCSKSVKYLTYIAIDAMYSQCISIYFIIFYNHILMHQDWYRQKRLWDVTIWMWPCYEIPSCPNGFMSFVRKCWTCQAWLQQQSVETIHQPTVLEQYTPNKLTQNLTVTLLKRRIIFPICSFGFHVRFPECKSLC